MPFLPYVSNKLGYSKKTYREMDVQFWLFNVALENERQPKHPLQKIPEKYAFGPELSATRFWKYSFKLFEWPG